ncbi:MAG: acyl-CoA dehydrogenase family protein [Steroidobacteraceae bacterium]
MESSEARAGELSRRVRDAAVIAATHAEAVDTDARFPAEGVAAIKAQRLLGIMLPTRLGGEEAPLSQVGDVCYQLAQACASTAMIFAMHQIKTACILRHMRDNPMLQGLLRRLSAEQLLLASSTTEGQSGGNVRASEAPVEYQGDRISLERRASVISYGAYADGIVTTARRSADAAASDQVLVAFLKSDYTLTRLQGWNTMGMRGTCSEGYTLKATGSAGQIVADAYEVIHSQTMVPTAHLLWGSVWAGIAAGAAAKAQAFIRQAARQTNGQLPPGAPQFTKVVAALRTLRALMANSMRVYERDRDDAQALARLEFQSMITLTKVEASEMAVAIVLAAMRVCGLSGYRRDGEFSIERSLRDVLSAPIMINNERILANLAGMSLVTSVPGSLHD